MEFWHSLPVGYATSNIYIFPFLSQSLSYGPSFIPFPFHPIDFPIFISCFTVITGPPLFSKTVQLLDPFPCRVNLFIKEIRCIHPYGQRLYWGKHPGSINAAFELWQVTLLLVTLCMHGRGAARVGIRNVIRYIIKYEALHLGMHWIASVVLNCVHFHVYYDSKTWNYWPHQNILAFRRVSENILRIYEK